MSMWNTILNNLPEVAGPTQKRLSFKEKLKWTLMILVIFFSFINRHYNILKSKSFILSFLYPKAPPFVKGVFIPFLSNPRLGGCNLKNFFSFFNSFSICICFHSLCL